MPSATVILTVLVTLDLSEEMAKRVSRDDLTGMARGVIPDSMTHPDPENGLGGAPNGTQVEINGVAQEDENGEPVFADVHIEHNITEDPEIEFDDDGFDRAEKE